MDSHELEQVFLQQIQRLCMPNAPLVVGVSGGADSMALMALLVHVKDKWPMVLYPVHIDHGLRPNAAQDALFVEETLRERFGLSVVIERIHIVPEAGESIEMAARRQRYAVLEQHRARYGIHSRIVVGHHQRDQAETVLMRVIMGTGVQGLQGMKEQNGMIIRPLLSFSPDVLREYLQANDLAWREDESNQDTYFLRNRIRWDLLPLLQRRFNPQIEQALAALAVRAQEAYALIHEQAQDFLRNHHIKTEDNPLRLPNLFGALNSAVQADIFEMIAGEWNLRLNRHHIEEAIQGRANWPKGVVVTRDIQGWRISRPTSRELPPRPMWAAQILPREGIVHLDPHNRLIIQTVPFQGPRPHVVQINKARWPQIAVRPWTVGDRIEPLGMKGHHKKIGDIFTDYKIPRHKRLAWPIIVAASDFHEILGIAGIMSAESARCSPGQLCTAIEYQQDNDFA
ncbi:MAG: tRNA lysidine(34) synthetase TilS [Sulfobacillus thermosulfidooxidans]|uniref:tRNA(Ile)-lysidine synthase n=1 Tax=Sulfobacillus thermosulfidooxidans TaxID=28034 RepID=A0A2T2X0T4_SULTH|nr:MAG: tRNA lysidine(34) synthetase TilS [Sulfobacillus thermosulfidooxidans]